MRKPHFTNRAAKGAFTLIEILVVLVIMGFLVSLVAPKLSGIVDSAVDTNCDTNQERLRKVLNAYVAQNGQVPSGLTNMVIVNTDSTTAAIPSESDGDKANGAEILSDEFTGRFLPQVHFLNALEAAELIGMGVKGVKTYAKTSDATTVAVDEENIVEEQVNTTIGNNVPVMMAGVGFTDSTDATAMTWSEGDTLTVAGSTVTEAGGTTALDSGTLTTPAQGANGGGTFARMDEAPNIARILMGVTEHGELVQEGLLDAAGVCPGQIQNEDQFSWGNYVAVLPRLQATLDRLTDAANSATVDGTMHALALGVDTGESAAGETITGRTPASGQSYFVAQSVSALTTSCPEGHSWGANADSYAVFID